MIGFNGGLIGKSNPTAAALRIPGVWTSREQEVAVRDNKWSGGLLLDIYTGATAAYSLRDLRAPVANSAVVRVRRSSDNTEQDFTALQVTDGTLTSFCGAGNGFIRTWYDQSTSGNNAVQTNTALQPRIVNSGVLDTDGGKPAIVFGGASNVHIAPASSITVASTAAFFLVTRHSTGSGGSWSFAIGENQGGATFTFGKEQSSTNLHITGTTVSGANIAQKAVSWLQTGTGVSQWRINAASGTLSNFTTSQNWRIGNRFNNTPELWVGPIQEVIYFPSNQVSNSSGIITAINTHYSIF